MAVPDVVAVLTLQRKQYRKKEDLSSLQEGPVADACGSVLSRSFLMAVWRPKALLSTESDAVTVGGCNGALQWANLPQLLSEEWKKQH